MRRRVFAPAGMRHTVADFTDSLVAWRTEYYVFGRDSVLLNGPYVDNSYKWAGGGFLSTPEDLVRFAAALREGRLAEPETVEILFAPQRTTDGEETGYGIGWSSGRDAAGRRMAWHGGGSVGGTTMLLLYPDDGVAVALAANLSDAPVSRELAERVAAGFLPAGGEE
jgi:CubicO group peptidase (beta-lactamase class C family)